MLENRLDLEAQLVLRQRHEPRGLGDGPFLPCAAIQPDLRTLVEPNERAVDRLFAHPMRSVRIGEISSDEDQVWPPLIEELPDDAHVFVADRVLAYATRAVKRKIEETGFVPREADRLEPTHRFGFANGTLEIEY